MKKITIVTPCYNEELNVRVCYDTIKNLFETHLKGYQREHIFADNASEDATADILRKFAIMDPAVKIILNSRNFGPFVPISTLLGMQPVTRWWYFCLQIYKIRQS